MRAVIIGPGRIGCGFVGELLSASGYELTMVARSQPLVAHFNRLGRYRVRLTSTARRRDVVVRGISGIWSGDVDTVADAIADADLVATSVGPKNLAAIAPLIAAGLARCTSPVNVLAFENQMNAGPCLQRLVRDFLPGRSLDEHGFSGAIVVRAVAQRIGEPDKDTPLLFLGDMPEDFVVHGPALRHPVPRLRGMVAVDNYGAWILRKLYVFSAGHATTAYLGALKGYHYIHTAIRDPQVRSAVIAAMREGQRGLAAYFGEEFVGGEQQIRDILARFENASVSDPIARVGRDPRRKLGANERLVGAARLAQRSGVLPDKLALATAAALCFCNSADPSCCELDRRIENSGVEAALAEYCGLSADDELHKQVATLYRQLEPGKHGNLLLNLDSGMWAWSNGGPDEAVFHAGAAESA